jgi:hypothetical protein
MGRGIFLNAPVQNYHRITPNTHTNSILHNKPPGFIIQIQLYGGGTKYKSPYSGALLDHTLVFWVSARSFGRPTQENYNYLHEFFQFFHSNICHFFYLLAIVS